MKTCECGVEIEFKRTPNGKLIPLHIAPQTYLIQGENAVPIVGVHQSHYISCPHANKFSGKNRDREP